MPCAGVAGRFAASVTVGGRDRVVAGLGDLDWRKCILIDNVGGGIQPTIRSGYCPRRSPDNRFEFIWKLPSLV